jgi:hypothetical protein
LESGQSLWGGIVLTDEMVGLVTSLVTENWIQKDLMSEKLAGFGIDKNDTLQDLDLTRKLDKTGSETDQYGSLN